MERFDDGRLPSLAGIVWPIGSVVFEGGITGITYLYYLLIGALDTTQSLSADRRAGAGIGVPIVSGQSTIVNSADGA